MTPVLTDTAALTRFRTRAAAKPALFLQEDVADEIQDRLAEVNRPFTSPAVVTPFAQVWRDRLPAARIVPDTEVLELEPGAHDLVIHALALHWANDPVGQLIQCRRALRPDGLLLVALFGGNSLRELRSVLAQAESDLRGTLSPRILPMGEIRDLGALLHRAGLALPVADSSPRRILYPTLKRLVDDLRGMGEVNALASRHRAPVGRDLWVRACDLYRETFADADGRLIATADVIFLTGWAPADTQPKPLRPGSATSRLADALGAAEMPLPDAAGPGSD
jgi:SAM-dependent methyltransferase